MPSRRAEKALTDDRRHHWKEQPEEHDYPAAASYLRLTLPPATADAVVRRLRRAALEHYKAKDLLRASGLPLLSTENEHVTSNLQKLVAGEQLSPVLLVRGDLSRGVPLTIADGYHRICASHSVDEDADIPCRVAELPRR